MKGTERKMKLEWTAEEKNKTNKQTNQQIKTEGGKRKETI